MAEVKTNPEVFSYRSYAIPKFLFNLTGLPYFNINECSFLTHHISFVKKKIMKAAKNHKIRKISDKAPDMKAVFLFNTTEPQAIKCIAMQ